MHVPESPLYPILDSSSFPRSRREREIWLRTTVDELSAAGVSLLQLRAKEVADETVLRDATTIREAAEGRTTLLLNDRVLLLEQAAFHGVHLGQTDMPVETARSRVGATAILGVSTHSAEQVREADTTSADYIAIGPIFPTQSKADAEPVVGLEGLRTARSLTRKPLVAIGGITLADARSVWDAGADSVAVIGALFASSPDPGASPGRIARDFLRLFRYNSL